MNNARRSRLGLALAGLYLALIVAPLSAGPMDSLPSMDVVRSKLELTPEQEVKLRPLFDSRLAELQQTRIELEQAASKADKQTILRDAKQKADAFNRSVENVLTPSQKPKWRELRSATREKLKQKYDDKHE